MALERSPTDASADSTDLSSPNFYLIPPRRRWLFSAFWLLGALALSGLTFWAWSLPPSQLDMNSPLFLFSICLYSIAVARFLVWKHGSVPWPWRWLGAIYVSGPIALTAMASSSYSLHLAPAIIVIAFGLVVANVHVQALLFLGSGDYRRLFAAWASMWVAFNLTILPSMGLDWRLYISPWVEQIAHAFLLLWILDAYGLPRGPSAHFDHRHR